MGAKTGSGVERLSSKSSVLPFGFVSESCVKDDEQFSHAGSDGGFRRLFFGDEALMEGGDYRIVPYGDEGWHIEGGAQGFAPALTLTGLSQDCK